MMRKICCLTFFALFVSFITFVGCVSNNPSNNDDNAVTDGKTVLRVKTQLNEPGGKRDGLTNAEWNTLLDYSAENSDSLALYLIEIPGQTRDGGIYDTVFYFPVIDGAVDDSVVLPWGGWYYSGETWAINYPITSSNFWNFYTPTTEKIFLGPNGDTELIIFLTCADTFPVVLAIENPSGTYTEGGTYRVKLFSPNSWFPGQIIEGDDLAYYTGNQAIISTIIFQELAYADTFHIKIYAPCNYMACLDFKLPANLTINDTVNLAWKENKLEMKIVYDHDKPPVVQKTFPLTGSTVNSVNISKIGVIFNKPTVNATGDVIFADVLFDGIPVTNTNITKTEYCFSFPVSSLAAGVHTVNIQNIHDKFQNTGADYNASFMIQ